MIKLSFFLKDV